MSINWVMTSPNQEAFVKLPNEQILYTSPARTTLDLSTPNKYPGSQPLSIKSDGGVAYITNQRLVYLPTNPTTDLKNFSSPILNMQDTFVRAPFFGANYWTAAVRPVAGGGIPSAHPIVELRMTFKDGGAFDFHTSFEKVKERLYNAVQLAREEGRNVGNGSSGVADLTNVHLDQLPAYEANGNIEAPAAVNGVARASEDNLDSNVETSGQSTPDRAQATYAHPNEPPPGYEEAQFQAVGIDLDRRLRDEARWQ